jgi:hypothetical protein
MSKDFFLSIFIGFFIVSSSVLLSSDFYENPSLSLPLLPEECLFLLDNPHRRFEDFLDLDKQESSSTEKERLEKPFDQSVKSKGKKRSASERIHTEDIPKNVSVRGAKKNTRRLSVYDFKKDKKQQIVPKPITEKVFPNNFSRTYLVACHRVFSQFSENEKVKVALLYLMASDYLSYKSDNKGNQAALAYSEILLTDSVDRKKIILFYDVSENLVNIKFLTQAIIASYMYQKPYPLTIKDKFPYIYGYLEPLNSSSLVDVYSFLFDTASSITGKDLFC